jgi:hypothetical protein
MTLEGMTAGALQGRRMDIVIAIVPWGIVLIDRSTAFTG